MKTKNTLTTLIAVIALMALSLPVTVFAEMKDMPMHHGESHGKMMEMGNMDKMGDMMGMCVAHSGRMGLTDEQIIKIKPLHNDLQKKQAQFKADHRIAEIELAEIMDIKDFNLEKAGIAVKKIAEIKTAYHLELLKTMKDIRTILTDDQFKNMSKMMSMKADTKKPGKKMMKK